VFTREDFVERHIKTLGTLHIIYGFLLVSQSILAMIGIRLLKVLLHNIHGAIYVGNRLPYITSAVLMDIIWATLIIIPMIIAIPCLAGGFGLLNEKSWGRPVALVVGIIMLFNSPLGTVLGIYTIWVLMKPAPVENVAHSTV